MPPRLIIELNRCFEPNAFNTGPPIPTAPAQFTPLDIYSLLPRSSPLALHPDLDPPDLSASPSSSVSSSLSLKLEDEDIKRIFSHPRYDPQDHQQQQHTPSYSVSQLPDSYSPYTPSKEVLNPFAAPFVPSFVLAPNDDSFINSSPCFHKNVIPLPTVDSPRLHSQPLSPLHPPGLPHPSVSFSPQSGSDTPSAELPQRPDPAYLPVFLDALKPSTTPREREVLMKFIVTSIGRWDIDCLLELAGRICLAAYNPGPDFDKDGQELPACDLARYLPAEGLPGNLGALQIEEGQKPEDIVAMVAEELHRQFLTLHGEDIAQNFAWNLREVVLMRFIQCWDCVKPGSISYRSRPSSRFVRSSLTLCKSIATLYKRNLIGQEHISMCISILLKDLMSVEHADALSNIVLGCGPTFWIPSTLPGCHAETTLPQDTLLLAQDQALQMDNHVNDFLAGLEANFISRGLGDDKSVVGQSWGKGQLLERLADIVDYVRGWEDILTSGSQL
ncbi:hypothetical protein BDZ97DRAFT_1916996 [Flammula alnicola]|nr:hypothetical protein BDZ97DRAFT_1916996 [Flammula alnicola]